MNFKHSSNIEMSAKKFYKILFQSIREPTKLDSEQSRFIKSMCPQLSGGSVQRIFSKKVNQIMTITDIHFRCF